MSPQSSSQAATGVRASDLPICDLGGVEVRAFRFAEDAEFVRCITRLRAAVYGEDGPWHYGWDRLDRQAVQMVAFESATPVGALRLCLGNEVFDRAGAQGFYLSGGFDVAPGAEAFLATTIEYGRLWVVKGSSHNQRILNALLLSISAFAARNPRYETVCGTLALLDHTAHARQLIVDYLHRYHLPCVRRTLPRAPFERAPAPSPGIKAEAPKAFRKLVQQLRVTDPEHPLPFLLFLYLRQGATMLGEVGLDETGRKLLVPLQINMGAFHGFASRIRASSAPGQP